MTTEHQRLQARVAELETQRDELLAELDGRDDEARERWIQKNLDETRLRSVDFRNGAEMELEPARELVAHWVAAARTMLGEAPNYTETVAMDVKVAESPERYSLVVQRLAPGALTPHQARQKAEQRVAELEAERDMAAARALEDFAGRLTARAASMGAEYFRVDQVADAARRIATEQHGAAVASHADQ